MDIRALVRSKIPGSDRAYEWGEHRIRLREGRRRARSIQASGRPIWLDLGGGARAGQGGWLTVDTTRQCDLYWDLRHGIPFATGSVDRLYSSHLLEHLTFAEGQVLLRECLRALRPGGSLSIAVPNARMYMEAYLAGDALPETFFGWQDAFNDSTSIDVVNYIAYMDGHHKYMFDQENLVRRLELVGFADVRERAFDPETDLQERDYESLYAIGFKSEA